jgi:HAD superfamily hydrolase (TIGR01509 family)
MRLARFRMVIFDCDGVLVDSEPISQRFLAAEAAAMGCPLSEAEHLSIVGLTWSALKPWFEGRIGRALPADWARTMQGRLIPLLAAEATPVSHAREVVAAARAMGFAYRIASNSSHEEMQQKFMTTGLMPLVEGRLHSARDVARGKPAPDVYLAAAAAEGVAPDHCLVIEDSVPGVAAGLAAGMQVIAYAPPEGPVLRHERAPHGVVRSLAELVPIFRDHAAETVR